MKVNEIRSLDEKSLGEKLSELKMELVKINAQIAIGTTPKNPGQVRKIKKTIARIMNVRKEKQEERRTREEAKKSSGKKKGAGNKKASSSDKKQEVEQKHE